METDNDYMEIEKIKAAQLKLKGYGLIQQLKHNLYQYRACSEIKDLVYICKNIWLSCLYAKTPENMNDPFDSSIGFCEEYLIKSYLKVINPDCYSNISIDLNRVPESEMALCADMCKKIKEILESIKMTLYVSCLTYSGWNNPLMWAHYANSYHGACVEYDKDTIDLDHAWFNRITYVHEKPVLSVLNDFGLPILDTPEGRVFLLDDVLEQLYTKEQSWSYEREYRIIQTYLSKYKMDFSYIPLKICSVTLGLNIDPIFMIILLKICKYTNLRCYKLEIQSDCYDLGRKQIEETYVSFNPWEVISNSTIIDKMLEELNSIKNLNYCDNIDLNQTSLLDQVGVIEKELDNLLYKLCLIFCVQCLLHYIETNNLEFQFKSEQEKNIHMTFDAIRQFNSDFLYKLLKRLELELPPIPLNDTSREVFLTTIHMINKILELVKLLQNNCHELQV